MSKRVSNKKGSRPGVTPARSFQKARGSYLDLSTGRHRWRKVRTTNNAPGVCRKLRKVLRKEVLEIRKEAEKYFDKARQTSPKKTFFEKIKDRAARYVARKTAA